MQRKPSWLKVKLPSGVRFNKINKIIKNNDLHTICREAKCPNVGECFGHGTATFLVLGDTCTRNCGYCNVNYGVPGKIDENEPNKIADAVKKIGLRYVVITSVTRDDLSDGGSTIFFNTTKEIKKKNKNTKVELLIPDLKNNEKNLKKVINSKPDVLGHNIEVTKNLFKKLRPQGDYSLSLKLLKNIKEMNKNQKTKSGLMMGLGEGKEDVIRTMEDLRNAEVDFLTIGQYLQPRKDLAEVKKFYTPEEFEEFRKVGMKMGFEHVESGPLVRSSYRADKLKDKINWRLIDTGNNDAFYNMAVDEALMKLSKVPALRLYCWKPAAVSIGYFQDINDINLKFCRENNIDVVRRITGGKAVFHDGELTYSFIIDENQVPKNVIDSYKLISNSILIALKNLGINANFKDENVKKDKTPVCLNNPSWYEIIVRDKKIAAAAQTRKNKKLLQHGPILMDVDYGRLCSIFKKNNKKLLEETKKRITSLKQLNKKINHQKLKNQIKKGFEENFNIRFKEDVLTKKEEDLIKKLVKEKYKTKKWNCKK